MKLIYLTMTRLPGERAHAYQISKMCEVFSTNGVAVTLVHPFRYQSPAVGNKSVFEFYNLQRNFQIKQLPNWDFFFLNDWLPAGLFRIIYSSYYFFWCFYAVLAVGRQPDTIYYSRDLLLVCWSLFLGQSTVYEAHVISGNLWLLRLFARSSNLKLIVVITSFLRERFIKKGFPEKKVMVASDAVDLERFANLPAPEECRRRLGLPQDQPIIGYIGRFESLGEEKGIRELIQARALLKDPALLLCVGGPMRLMAGYKKLAKDLDLGESQVKFFDYQPINKVPLWIRACDVVTIPWPWTEFSAYFTSPLKLFEYMAAGVPIVASDLPSLREVLNENNAVLVKPGDPLALAEGLEKLLKNSDFSVKIAEQAKVEVQKYTWQNRARRILDEIR